MKHISILLFLFIFVTPIYSDNNENPSSDTSTSTLDKTPSFGKTSLNIKETRRPSGPSIGDDKTRVLDFDGNDVYRANKPPEPKPMAEMEWTDQHKPRPVFDLRRKENVDTVY